MQVQAERAYTVTERVFGEEEKKICASDDIYMPLADAHGE